MTCRTAGVKPAHPLVGRKVNHDGEIMTITAVVPQRIGLCCVLDGLPDNGMVPIRVAKHELIKGG